MNNIPTSDQLGTVEKIVLEKIKLAALTYISPEVLKSMRVDIALHDLVSGDLEYAIRCKLSVPGKIEAEEFVTGFEEVPVTWWDHFKAAHGWKHKTRRITKRVENRVTKVCPHLNVASRGPHLEFLMMNEFPERRRI
jgi:hypothetical protein